jgi:membrane protein implicated in regulation of membrane protease activity
MIWWLWIIIGLLVLSLEILIPLDFFLVFVGLSGVVTGIISGITHLCGFEISSSTQYIICSITLVLLFAFAKKPLVQHLMSSKKNTKSSPENDRVSIEGSNINPNDYGNGRTRGTIWTVHNLSNAVLEAGKSYKVSRTEGITLIVE